MIQKLTLVFDAMAYKIKKATSFQIAFQHAIQFLYNSWIIVNLTKVKAGYMETLRNYIIPKVVYKVKKIKGLYSLFKLTAVLNYRLCACKTISY